MLIRMLARIITFFALSYLGGSVMLFAAPAPVISAEAAPVAKTSVVAKNSSTRHAVAKAGHKKKTKHQATDKKTTKSKAGVQHKAPHKKNSKAVTHSHKTVAHKGVKHSSAASHVKAVPHHPSAVVTAVNPLDHVINKNDQMTFDLAQDNQDLVSGGFNQQIKTRLASYQSGVGATAEAQIGKPYQWGVEDPAAGFDCSGLSQFVYAQEGIQIPRTALQQYHSLLPVKHLQEGDLVFFRTNVHTHQVSHVGIYIGDGYFVHSPRTGQNIRVSSLHSIYWSQHYAGARRVLTSNTIALSSEAEVEDDS